jgi:hypothetical protein
LLKNADVFGFGLAVQAHLACELGVIAHLSSGLRQCLQEPWQVIDFFDARDIPHVTREDGVKVLPGPCGTP